MFRITIIIIKCNINNQYNIIYREIVFRKSDVVQLLLFVYNIIWTLNKNNAKMHNVIVIIALKGIVL